MSVSALAPPQSRHRATRLQGWPQRIAHLAVLVAGWGLFVWGWYRVSLGVWDTRPLVILIVGSLLLLPTMTVAWILHNKRIYRVKGPRKGVPTVALEYRRDWNGRTVDADWASLSAADLIVVDVDGDRKLYRGARFVEGGPGAAVGATAEGDAQREVA